MAITLADFTKIWASTSPLTPYSFSESNYKEGWNFIGSTPPARQMWDGIQKQNDEKMKYIVDNFLPATGGTITGNLEVNGNLTQNGKIVERVNASGSNYIRYENGLQICFGKTENLSSANADVYTDITLPASFIDTDYSVTMITCIVSGGFNNHSLATGFITTTSFRAYLRNLNSTAYSFYFMWIAIGYWK